MLMRWVRFLAVESRVVCWLVIGLFILGSSLTLTHAAEVDGLYSVDVPVHGQGNRERLRAIRAGLSTVFIKVSGQRSASEQPAMVALFESPMQFVERFRYHVLPDVWQQAVDDKGRFYSELLRIRFDAQSIMQVLREAGLPVWGRARPTTLIWLAVEDWNQRSIVGADNLIAISQVLTREADQRGVPVILPLLDLQDQTQLNFADIWGDFEDDILKASARYQPGGVLVGRLYRQAADQWQARWTLYQQNNVQRWITNGLQQQALIAGLGNMADLIAGQFAQLSDEFSDVRVSVLIRDVSTLTAYARVLQYLETLGLTKKLVVERVMEDSVIFALSVRGDVQGFKQTVKLGDTLISLESPLESLDRSSDRLASVTINNQQEDAIVAKSSVLIYRLLP